MKAGNRHPRPSERRAPTAEDVRFDLGAAVNQLALAAEWVAAQYANDPWIKRKLRALQRANSDGLQRSAARAGSQKGGAS